jgi:hypothetical protein
MGSASSSSLPEDVIPNYPGLTIGLELLCLLIPKKKSNSRWKLARVCSYTPRNGHLLLRFVGWCETPEVNLTLPKDIGRIAPYSMTSLLLSSGQQLSRTVLEGRLKEISERYFLTEQLPTPTLEPPPRGRMTAPVPATRAMRTPPQSLRQHYVGQAAPPPPTPTPSILTSHEWQLLVPPDPLPPTVQQSTSPSPAPPSPAGRSIAMASHKNERPPMMLMPHCVICLEEPRSHLLIPCFHLLACSKCIQRFGPGSLCPICRTVVVEAKEVFVV